MAKAKKTTKKKTARKTTKKTAAAKKPGKKSSAKKNSKVSNKASGSAGAFSIGASIPDFTLPSTEGKEFRLSDYKGKKVVLYFYPKDSTPGCTVEGIEFSAALNEFKKNNAVVFGISRDSLKSHDNFKCKYNFGFELLSDSAEKACKLFDVIKEKNMYGRMVLGIERSTFLIDENGKLKKEWRKVKAEGHAKEVLEALNS